MVSADFDAMMEDDSWLQDSPTRLSEPVSKHLKKRSKACNIDELLKDHYKDKNRSLDREAKRFKTFVSDSEDSEDEEVQQKTHKEVQFEKLVETCEKQVHAGGATLEVPRWGERLFSGQMCKESPMPLKVDNPVVQALVTSKRQCSYESTEPEKEEQFAESLVEELLATGWFLSFKVKLDNDMLSWMFHRMVFTNDNTLEKAACDFLCHTLEIDFLNCSWIPSYKTISGIFEAYGYARPQTLDYHTSEGSLNSQERPPHNLGSLLRLLMTSMKQRHLHKFHTREDVEDIAVLIASLSLDRSLLCFGVLIKESLEIILNSLTQDEWHISCERIATCMAMVDRHVVNCLKLTRALHSREDRMKRLQSVLALHFFAKIPGEKEVSGVWEMLSVFRKTDVKRTVVDFGNLYYQMCMADIWLWSNTVLALDKGALEAWLHFLKSCSFQISSTDWRPYATKVRNQASYLLQVYQCHYPGDDYEET
ncbi:hypothetical protein GOP47_0011473 [Adiantum capillus-veneris]|uniref:Coiled-coil SMC6 And NSE5 INteracting (CANIN) domain-containing protein n=1 Tax=Adiantum capillus-veneris TaxID=13818 RepID=A0A9D4UTC2_ADICA|nr:hypothetical protein GOP47_0011473 [Adiantum capillus-veneris]